MHLRDQRLAESSALVASARFPGLLWTVADSGNPAELYGVRAGRLVAVARVAGAHNVDWEALAPGPHDTLWIGDIGDNARRRDIVTLYEVAEPAPRGQSSVAARVHRLRYPDGPHDAEALLVHPRTGRVLVVTKDLFGAGVYAAPPLRAGRTATLRRVADAPPLVTDGAWSPDGRRLVLRTYTSAGLSDAPGTVSTPVALPAQPQGEAVTWEPDGTALIVGSEGRDSTVWLVPLSASLMSAPAAATSATARPSPSPSPVGRTPAASASPGGVAPYTGAANARSAGVIALAAFVVAALWARAVLLRRQARARSRREARARRDG